VLDTGLGFSFFRVAATVGAWRRVATQFYGGRQLLSQNDDFAARIVEHGSMAIKESVSDKRIDALRGGRHLFAHPL
jgi:hypothetical protein